MCHARSRPPTVINSHTCKCVHLLFNPFNTVYNLTPLHTRASHPSGLQGGEFTWIFCKPPPLHVRDMPPALQPERPCLEIIQKYEKTVEQCRSDPLLRVDPECVEDMEDIMRLLRQEDPLPCEWYGGVVCGHVAGVRREGGVNVLEVVQPSPVQTIEFEVDDFVTVATTMEEEEAFWLAKVLRVDGDDLWVMWYESTHAGQSFGTYKPAVGGDHGRHTQSVSSECCFTVKIKDDGRSTSGGVKIKCDVYGGERGRIMLAMSHGRLRMDMDNSQENE